MVDLRLFLSSGGDHARVPGALVVIDIASKAITTGLILAMHFAFIACNYLVWLGFWLIQIEV